MERNLVTSSKTKTRRLTTFAMLAAIAIILGFTPLGIIPVPPVGATIMHIPVIIIAILEGPVLGALMGLVFGLISLTNAIIKPTALSFAGLNPLVSVMPRILIGIVAYYVYKGLPIKSGSITIYKKLSINGEAIKIGASAAVATLMNTIGFLGMIYLLYGERAAEAVKQPVDVIGKFLAVLGLTHGLPEAIVAIIIVTPIIFAVKKMRK